MKVKQPVVVNGTFVNGEFVINNFSLPNEKLCLVYRQLYVEKAASLEIGVQGLKYRLTTEEVEDGILVKRQRILWREGENFYIEKLVEEDA